MVNVQVLETIELRNPLCHCFHKNGPVTFLKNFLPPGVALAAQLPERSGGRHGNAPSIQMPRTDGQSG